MLGALAFLTIFGGARAPGSTTLRWLPVVGAVVGGLVAAAHWGAHEIWPPVLAGIAVVAVDAVITGALHLDGTADSADGLLPHMDRKRRLAVMSEPTVGVFAVVVLAVVLGLRWAALSDPTIEAGSLVALWALSRTFAAVVPAVAPYARSSGLASPFLTGASRWIGVTAVPAVIVLVIASSGRGAVAVLVALCGAGAVVLLAVRRLGGFTGDVLGATIVVSETAALLALGSSL